ncbi:MAG: hypothetical protein IT378_05400 [Sandaracinaceae bacterium]|nr:hypothetical protein [Sandaracinaceae bacterium]MCC6873729.1 hypothetical protein [Sandaracinaceae bacterium]
MKGEVRSPVTTWLICTLCTLYAIYWVYLVNNELKNYLGKEDLNPMMEAIFTWACLPYGLMRLGGTIQEAQQRAGIANAENQGTTFLIWWFICGMGYKKAQEEINKIWESGGGAPATF